MAPKPSKEKPVNEPPSSEESQDDESQDDDGSSKLKINSKSVNQEDGLDSDSDLGTPSSYKLQPLSRVSKSSSKRTHADKSERPERKRKMAKSEQGKFVGSSSNGCITRLWSEKDEITVLKGLIELENTDTWALHNFIKGKLQTDFSKDQLNSKIKRLKKRFLNALKKSENGDDPVFTKPHEDKAFVLSKRIWGESVGMKGENGIKDEDENEVLKVGKVESEERENMKNGKDVDGGVFSESKYPFLSRSFDNLSSTMPSLDMSKSGMSFALRRLSSSKAKELDQKWKVLITEEVELNHKKLALMEEQMNMALASDSGE